MKPFYVISEIKNNIGIITFYHPKSNSFPTVQLQNLINEIYKLGDNQQVKIIILQSEGKEVFCAGASFDELLTISNLGEAKTFFMGFAQVLFAMRNCPKFIIGNIQGKVVGGGVGIVAACDYAFALNNASLRLSELSIGIGPFVIEPAITRKIGIQSFTEMTLSPIQWKTSKWAQKKGIYNKVYKKEEKLTLALDVFANSLLKYSPEAMIKLKQIFWQNTNDWEVIMPQRATMSAELVLTPYTQNILKRIKK